MFRDHALLSFGKKIDSLVAIITVIFMVGSLLVPSNKLFFIWSTLYLISIFWITRSFEKTFIYTFFVLQIFRIGQLYIFNVISPEKLNLPLYPRGRDLYFKFSPFFALNIAVFLGLFVQFFKYKSLKAMSIPMFVCLIGVIIMLFSSMNSRYLPVVSVLYVFVFLGSWAWVFFTKTFFLFSKKESIFRILRTLLLILIFLSIFESLIVVGQEIKGAPLGFLVEQLNMLTYFGVGADENPFFIRPAGLHDDSNNLAFYFMASYSAILILWFWLEEKKELFLNYSYILTTTGLIMLTIIFSQSRSVYLAFFVFFFFLFFLNRNLRIKLKEKLKLYENYIKVIFVFLAIFGAVILPDRCLHTLYSFTKYGGVEIRNQLNDQALELIRRHPLFGVGLQMFIPASFEENYNGVSRGFPESVHNGFLLVLSECGLLVSFCFILFYYFLFRKTFFSKNSFLVKSVFYLGLISCFIIMFFQPFFGILTINVMFWILLVDLKYEKTEKS